MIDESYYERLHELVAEMLAAGPLPLEVVIERLDAQGVLEELRDDGVPDDGLGDALLDEAMLTESVWVTASETLVLPAQLAEGLVLTHRLTADEVARGEVTICPDLVVLDDAVDGQLDLVPGGRLDYCFPPEPVPGEDLSTYAGPDGWLAGFAPGDLVAFTRRGRTVSVTKVDEPADDEREVQLLRDAADGRLGPGTGEEAHPLVLDALTADLGAFRRPVRPVGELLEAAGLERRGFSFGRAGETWRTYVEVRGDRRRADAARQYGFDTCCTTALDLVSDVFGAFDHEDGVGPAVLTSLAHGAVAPAFAETLFDWHAERLTTFADHLVTVARGREAAPALLLRATALGWQGDVLAAEAALREALQRDPDYGPAALELAGYEIDRGNLDRAITLLHHPELRPAAESLEMLEVLRAEQEDPYRHTGRNDPCPCGSGRKFKVCCQRRPIVPLAVRTKALSYKLRRYLSRGDWDSTVVGVASSACDPDDPDLPMSLATMSRNPLIADFVTFEGLAAEEYLERRGALLPDDERDLLARLLDEPRRLWEITGVKPGAGLTLCDTATGEALDVVERLGSQRAEVGQLLLARVARLGDQNQMMGIPVEVPLRLRASALELVDEDPDADELARWYGEALAFPRLSNREGEPLLLCHAELDTAVDLPDLHAALDPILEADDDRWTDLWDAPDGDRVVRGSVRFRDGRLLLDANSEVRYERLLKAVTAAVPDAVIVVEEETDPRRAARVGGQEADFDDGVPPEAAAFVDELLRRKEAEWVDESIPALGGLTLRQALDDPTQREDLLSLLREFESASQPGAGGFDVGRLRALLGLTPPS